MELLKTLAEQFEPVLWLGGDLIWFHSRLTALELDILGLAEANITSKAQPVFIVVKKRDQE